MDTETLTHPQLRSWRESAVETSLLKLHVEAILITVPLVHTPLPPQDKNLPTPTPSLPLPLTHHPHPISPHPPPPKASPPASPHSPSSSPPAPPDSPSPHPPSASPRLSPPVSHSGSKRAAARSPYRGNWRPRSRGTGAKRLGRWRWIAGCRGRRRRKGGGWL